jgi:hypothetical protein
MQCVYNKSTGDILGLFSDDSDTARIVSNWEDSDSVYTDQNPPMKEMVNWSVDLQDKVFKRKSV